MNETIARPRISLRDIAKKLGLSHSTVSMALREHPRISVPVRDKVHSVAREMGYQPDPLLSALARYRKSKGEASVRPTIAWLNCTAAPGEFYSDRESALCWHGASAAAEKFGYRLEEFVIGPQLSAERLRNILLNRGINGIILPPCSPVRPEFHEEFLRDFIWEHFSIVRLSESWRTPCAQVVTRDRVSNTLLAVKSMQELGYARVGLVTGKQSFPETLLQAGFYLVQAELNPSMRLPPLILKSASINAQRRQLGAWMKQHKAEAILTDLPDLRTLLEGAGYRVPEDVGLAAECWPGDTIEAGIDHNPEEIGRTGVLAVISLINDQACGAPLGSRQILVSGKWKDGATLPPRRSFAARLGAFSFEKKPAMAS